MTTLPKVRRGGVGWYVPPRPRQERDAQRGSAHKRGYDKRWQAASAGHLALSPLCVCCKANGVITAAVLVDHIVPHRGDMRLFWDAGNWQSLCKRDHDSIKQQLEQQWLRGEIAAELLRLDRKMPEIFGIR